MKKTEKVGVIDFAIGGQAVLEGVMMRSPNFYTVSVRNPDGKICCTQKKFRSITKKVAILSLPILRGLIHLAESMMIGFRALSYSSDVFLGEEEKKVPRGRFLSVLYAVGTGLYVIFTFAFTIFLLKFLPLFVAEKVAEIWSVAANYYIVFNAIDGLTKIILFLGYLFLISLLPDIKRVFEYHGAEHKVVFTYEKGLALTVANARKQSRFHPRCGTSFIFIVILMSVLVYTLLPSVDGFWPNLGQRILALPLIAGLSYELLKLSAKFQSSLVVRALIWPGLMLQRLTTREPKDDQIEVALNSLKKSLESEESLSAEF
jgi:uncharacterized protein YqhQ